MKLLDYPKNTKIYAEMWNFGRDVTVLISEYDAGGQGRSRVMLPLEPKWSEWTDSDREQVEPTLHFHGSSAVALMNALWDAGVRPTIKNYDPVKEIEAINRHLADMRHIAFAKLNIKVGG